MKFAHIAEQIYLRPWFITASAHASIRLIFQRAMAQGFSPKALEMADMFVQRKPLAIDSEGIATIHVLGPVGKGLSKMEQSCGATGMEQIRGDYAAALQQNARGLLLHFDSPGGTTMGTPEVAAMIGSQAIPTVAFTEDMMASAAYYMAAGANKIIASPSAEVGSIGVYIPWADTSAQYEAEGIKPDPIVGTGGDLKAMGFGGKLTEVQREFLQDQVDASLADFKKHVTSFRSVPAGAMRGQTLSGKQAVDSNLIDELGDMDRAKAVLRSLIG